MRSSLLLIVCILFAGRGIAADPADVSSPKDGESTPVERVTERTTRDAGSLGTTAYSPSESERPFFDKLAESERASFGGAEDYDITKKKDAYVAWFGVVREVSMDKATARTTLTVEHKYFDGLTDTHILALSFNGSGDFQALLHGIDQAIKPLDLVRVYGKVTEAGKDELPKVDAMFVRIWEWGTFTFILNYGTQRGSEKWRRLNSVPLEDIYDPEPETSYYIDRLGDRPENQAKEAAFRDRATKAAELLHRGAGETIAPLLDRLLHPRTVPEDAPTFADVFVALLKVGAEQAAVTAFADALTYHNVQVRRKAAEELEAIGPEAKSAVPALVAALADKDQYVRSYAANTLGRLGSLAQEAIPALIALTKDGDSHVRARACEALGDISQSDGGAIDSLVSATNDEDHFVRFMAVDALERFGDKAARSAKRLVELLETDEDDNVRWQAAYAIGAVDPQGLIGVQALIQAVSKSPSPNIRRFAARGLSRMGTNARAAVPSLLVAAKDSDAGVRISAAEALWKVDKNTKQAMAVLRPALVQGDWPSRMWAANAVEAIGPDARAAIDELKQAIGHDVSHVQCTAAEALGSVGGDEAARVLAERLHDKNGELRVGAASALWRVNQDPRALQSLMSLLNEGDGRATGLAAEAIAKIGTPAKDAEPALKKMLHDPSASSRVAAAEALKAIKPK